MNSNNLSRGQRLCQLETWTWCKVHSSWLVCEVRPLGTLWGALVTHPALMLDYCWRSPPDAAAAAAWGDAAGPPPPRPETDGNPAPVWKTRPPFITLTNPAPPTLLSRNNSEASKFSFCLTRLAALFSHSFLYLAELNCCQLNMLFHMLHYWTCSSIIHSFPHESLGNCEWVEYRNEI